MKVNISDERRVNDGIVRGYSRGVGVYKKASKGGVYKTTGQGGRDE